MYCHCKLLVLCTAHYGFQYGVQENENSESLRKHVEHLKADKVSFLIYAVHKLIRNDYRLH